MIALLADWAIVALCACALAIVAAAFWAAFEETFAEGSGPCACDREERT